MRDNNQGFDFQAIADSIGKSIRQAGEALSRSAKPAELWTEAGLRHAILVALSDAGKTGHDVMTTIEATHEWRVRPTAAKVYPMLESLLDEQLVSVSVLKDRKVYALTKTGRSAVKSYVEQRASDESSHPREAPAMAWSVPQSELTSASGRLAKTALEVARYGTAEQQKAAAAAIDAARRKLHEILSVS